MNKRIKISAEVNGKIYESEVRQIIMGEEMEQIASYKRHIRSILNEDGLTDVMPVYVVEKLE